MACKPFPDCIKVTMVLSFLLLLQTGFAQKDFRDLDALLEQKQRLLGKDFVVMIWANNSSAGRNDTLVYKKEFGDFNSKTEAAIASCSKWLTAAMVMIFVDEGKLSLDDYVSNWLPEFARYGKNYITIRDCLCHMTGIRSEPITLLKMFERKKFSSLEEEVNSFAAKDIEANPGTEFRYSEIGLNTAGRILEIISKKKFDVLARQLLFVPLNMRKTSFSTLDGSAVNPSGGAVSTPDDYIHFLVMMLNKGVYQGKRILSEKSIGEMRKVETTRDQIKYAPKPAEGYNYASGAWVVEENSHATSPDGGSVATALASPGLFGTWPLVDYCRGYAYLFFVKKLLSEERADVQKEIKATIDDKFPGDCK